MGTTSARKIIDKSAPDVQHVDRNISGPPSVWLNKLSDCMSSVVPEIRTLNHEHVSENSTLVLLNGVQYTPCK